MQSYSVLTITMSWLCLWKLISSLNFQQNTSGCFWNHSSNSNSWTGNESTSRHAAESLLKNFGKGIGISNIIIIKFALAVKWIWGWHKWFQLCLLFLKLLNFQEVAILEIFSENCLWLWNYAELVTLVDIISTVLDPLWIADPVSAKRRIFNSRWSICCLNLNCCCNLWKEEIFSLKWQHHTTKKKRLKFVASLSAYTTHQIKDTQQQRKGEVFYKIW